jgi:hypothetical protein
VSNGKCLDLLEKMSRLGVLSPEKFPASGNIKKDICNLDPRSGCLTGILHLGDFSADNLNTRPNFLFPQASGEPETGDTCDAWKSFPPETERVNCSKIGTLLDFACGMTFQAEKGIGTIHPPAIIGHANEAYASMLKFHRDPPGPGINGVFQEFLDHGGRALHHLTGRYLACQHVGKESYLAHN